MKIRLAQSIAIAILTLFARGTAAQEVAIKAGRLIDVDAGTALTGQVNPFGCGRH